MNGSEDQNPESTAGTLHPIAHVEHPIAPAESIPESESSPSVLPVATSTETNVSSGPLNLQQIRKLRESQQAAQRAAPRPSPRTHSTPKKESVPAGHEPTSRLQPAVHTSIEPAANSPAAKKTGKFQSKRNSDGGDNQGFQQANREPAFAPKVAVPSTREPLSADLQQELDDALIEADLDKLLVGDKSLQVGRELEDGARIAGRIIKIHNENVFVSLGGPDEGVVPLLQFNDMPSPGDQVECLIRAYNREDGLYELGLPGEAISVDDWSDLQEGSVVEGKIESANTGGLECLVGTIRGFIPMSQISEFRVETPADYVGQKLLCVVTEVNPRRGNLVLSHRAVLEREKREKRSERLAQLEIGQAAEGIVRKVMDFGAFVDIGGLDGLIHVSQLSWERVTHPSEIVKEGDKIQVRIEKIDPETGKIGLSYRALQDHPWEKIEEQFPVGSVVHGTISRIANFGAFVKIATGVEGLVHVSELAHRRVANVGSVVKEGEPVDVKILSVDREAQRISLSIKAVIMKPESESPAQTEAEVEEPPREPSVPKRQGPLKGGVGLSGGGEKFGLKW